MPPPGMPEVIPPIEVRALEMHRAIQLLAWEVLIQYCPVLTKNKYPKIHSKDRAMNNGDKNGYEGSIKHADWVNEENLTATNPRYDKMQRQMGGGFIRGVETFNLRIAAKMTWEVVSNPHKLLDTITRAFSLVRSASFAPWRIRPMVRATYTKFISENAIRVDPGVGAIDANNLPDLSTPQKIKDFAKVVVENNWVTFGVSTGSNDPANISHFPQTYIDGTQYPCAYLFIIDRPIYFRRDEFTVWESDELPEVTYIYDPVPSSQWRTQSKDQ